MGVAIYTQISGIQGTSIIGEGNSEAAMLASGAVVGTQFLRTDVGNAPGTLYECFALPSTTAANWRPASPINFGAVDDSTAMTALLPLNPGDYCWNVDEDAFYDFLGGDPTSVGSWRNRSAAAAITYASQAEAEAGLLSDVAMSPLRTAQAIEAQVIPGALVGAGTASYRGAYATYAEIVALADPVSGDQALWTSTDLPYPLVLRHDGNASKWRATAPVRMVVASKVAGSASASIQAAGWIKTLPASFYRVFGSMETWVRVESYADTDTVQELEIRVGSNSNGTSNTAIWSLDVAGAFMANTDDARGIAHTFVLSGSDSFICLANTDKQGKYNDSPTTAGVEVGTISISTDDFDDVLYLSASVTMGGATDTPTLTFIVDMVP